MERPPVSPDTSVHHGARRQASRVPLSADVRVIEPELIEGFVLNASEGGLRVVLERPVAVGTLLRLVVDVNGDAFEESARVVWVREEADGVVVGLARE